MNRKQFLILLVLVLVLGAASWMVLRSKQDSWHGGGAAIGRKLLPDLAVNDVAQISLKSGTGEVTLARDNHLWCVRDRAGYPANFSQLSGLLLKLADLKVSQNVDLGPSQMGRFELLPPGSGAESGTALELKDASGKTLGSLLLGKKHMKKPAANAQMGGMDGEGWPDGRYVLTGARTVALISDALEDVQAKPDQWLSKDFFAIEKPRAIAVQFPVATNSWKLTRATETGDWQLADARAGEKLDSSKIASVTSPFSYGGFNDVAPLTASNAPGNTVLTVETFDGFTYAANIGAKAGEDYPVHFSLTATLPPARTPGAEEKPADKTRLDAEFAARQKTLAEKLAKESAGTNWVYQLSAYSVDELLKPRAQLLAEAATNSAATAK